ncbi:MAG: glycosyltransferase [Tepidisphaeraceae bacterium]
MSTTIRVIDYTANAGGGVRFTSQLLPALMRQRAGARFELVSHGAALGRYQELLARTGVAIRTIDIAPDGTDWRFDVSQMALDGCDLAWLPWIHRHRVAQSHAGRVVGSFHDAILFQFEAMFDGLLPAGAADDERRTLRQWFASPAGIAVSSDATVATLGSIFGVPDDRLAVIPVSGEHAKPQAAAPALPAEWTWANEPFLLCPANISPHKNHETLLRGVAKWGSRRHRLVLTGDATHLDKCKWSRAVSVREIAEQCGFVMGESLIPLGYVSDEIYDALLQRAWALVMPTLAEGGGSFPVFEAQQRGIPVLCSDIPVLREQMARSGAQVAWFDPHEAEHLATQLRTFDELYPAWKTTAVNQIRTMRRRSWDDVATEYWIRFDEQLGVGSRSMRLAS